MAMRRHFDASRAGRLASMKLVMSALHVTPSQAHYRATHNMALDGSNVHVKTTQFGPACSKRLDILPQRIIRLCRFISANSFLTPSVRQAGPDSELLFSLMAQPGPSNNNGSSNARPGLGRRHSRSSSQLSTIGALSLTSLPARRVNGQSPSSSHAGSPRMTPRSSPKIARRSLEGSPHRMEGLQITTADSNESATRNTPGINDSQEWSDGLMMSTGKRQSGTSSPSVSLTTDEAQMLPPTDPTSAATISFPDTSPSLAQFIQQKRRQASAPYYNTARAMFTPGGGFGITSIDGASSGQTATSTDADAQAGVDGAGGTISRPRSRVSSRRGTVSGLRLDSGFGGDFAYEPAMVLTPTTEEWRQLAGDLAALAEARARDDQTNGVAGSAQTSGSSSSSSIDMMSPKMRSLPGSRPTSRPQTPPVRLAPTETPGTPPIPAIKSSFSYQTSRSGFDSPNAMSLRSKNEDGNVSLDSSESKTEPLPQGTFVPGHRAQLSESSSRPTLARGSLTSTTGRLHTETSPETEKPPPSPVSPPSPVQFDRVTNLGPIDPRAYSFITGKRSINSFVIEGEAGKGAYGSVVKAREKGPDGQPIGPPVIIKYIFKHRILADCWKGHKVFNAVPIEVHVLDHLRRVPYMPKPPGRRKPDGSYIRPVALQRRRDSAPSLKEGTLTGHPNICGMLDFFEDQNYYYLVMPHAGADPDNPDAPGGQDLFDYVDAHPDGLDADTIFRILSQIANAVYFLHEHGIVHRDIKDENVVLDRHGNVQLIDFGSAAYVKDGKKFDTFSGTVDFAAPEVLRGARYNGKEQDIWALGVLGYVLICGECPFWAQEEAIKGLEPGSRAYNALMTKLAHTRPSSSSSRETQSSSSDKLDNSQIKMISCASELEQHIENRTQPRTMKDAVDLVMRCMETNASDRPTADLVCEHEFFNEGGWKGHRGWEQPEVAED
ncbi:serine/threonine protein kinase [Microbotryomycetes sp. JL221]|nr:serine/threonine protein kinase [Microbotryomycetes sp. JL221]